MHGRLLHLYFENNLNNSSSIDAHVVNTNVAMGNSLSPLPLPWLFNHSIIHSVPCCGQQSWTDHRDSKTVELVAILPDVSDFRLEKEPTNDSWFPAKVPSMPFFDW